MAGRDWLTGLRSPLACVVFKQQDVPCSGRELYYRISFIAVATNTCGMSCWCAYDSIRLGAQSRRIVLAVGFETKGALTYASSMARLM